MELTLQAGCPSCRPTKSVNAMTKSWKITPEWELKVQKEKKMTTRHVTATAKIGAEHQVVRTRLSNNA